MRMEDLQMLMNSGEYLNLVQSIKQEIQSAQYRAALNVNRELICLYYDIGSAINEHKTWGNKFIENLATDIRLAFPEAKGYSVRNLKYMAKFALRFPNFEIVQAALAQITWYHHVTHTWLTAPMSLPSCKMGMPDTGDQHYGQHDMFVKPFHLYC